MALVFGSNVNTNLLIEKVCRYELGYNETVCENLSDYEDEETEGEHHHCLQKIKSN